MTHPLRAEWRGDRAGAVPAPIAVETILFDATGTLIEVRGGVGERYAAVAAGHGLSLDPRRVEETFAAALAEAPPLCFPGVPAAEALAAERSWWRAVVARTLRAASRGASAPDLMRGPAFEELFTDLYSDFSGAGAWCAAAGARDVLARLSGRGYALGVLSNFDSRLTGVLAELDLASYLGVVESSVSLGAAKPRPEAFLRALERLDAADRPAAYVGDSPETDARGAAGAGLFPVLLRADPPAGVGGIRIETLPELLEIFGRSPCERGGEGRF